MYFEDFKKGMVFESEESRILDSHLSSFLEQDFVGGYQKVYEEYCNGPKKVFKGRSIIPGKMTSGSTTSFLLKSVDFSEPAIQISSAASFKWPVKVGDWLKAKITVTEKEKKTKLVKFEVVLTNQDGKEVARGIEGFRVVERKDNGKITVG